MTNQSNNLFNRPWHRLNLDISQALRPEFVEYSQKIPGQGLDDYNLVPHFNPIDIFYPEWLDSLQNNHGIEFSTVIIFARDNHQDKFGHTDNVSHCAAINWCMGPDTRDMLWYSTKDNQYGEARCWTFDQLDLVDSCRIGSQPTLVRTDRPHSISSGTDRRVCVSIRFKPGNLSWSEAVSKLFLLIVSFNPTAQRR